MHGHMKAMADKGLPPWMNGEVPFKGMKTGLLVLSIVPGSIFNSSPVLADQNSSETDNEQMIDPCPP